MALRRNEKSAIEIRDDDYESKERGLSAGRKSNLTTLVLLIAGVVLVACLFVFGRGFVSIGAATTTTTTSKTNTQNLRNNDNVAAASGGAGGSRKEQLQNLIDFVRKNGGTIDFSRVRVDSSPYGNILVAARDLDEKDGARDQPVCLIPSTCMLTSISKQLLPETREAIARCCSDPNVPCDTMMQAATTVAMEIGAGSRSHWAPFTRYLEGEKLSGDGNGPWTLAASGNDEEMQLVKSIGATVLFESVQIERTRWDQAYQRCGVPRELFHLGAALVTTRAFSMQQYHFAGGEPDDKYVDTLIPIIELVNHRFDATNDYAWSEQFTNSVAFWPAPLPMKANDTIYYTYGPKASAELLCSYGFSETLSSFDYIELIAHLDKHDDGTETTWQCCLRPTHDSFLPELFVRARSTIVAHSDSVRSQLGVASSNVRAPVRGFVSNVLLLLNATLERIENVENEVVENRCECPHSRWSMIVTIHADFSSEKK